MGFEHATEGHPMTASPVATSATTENTRVTAPPNTTYVPREPDTGSEAYTVPVREPSPREK
jgi:hypothetical protein